MAALLSTRAKVPLQTSLGPWRTWMRLWRGTSLGRDTEKGLLMVRAVVKHHASTAVTAGSAVIRNAEELFHYLETSTLTKQPPVEGCVHSLRTFFWVREEVTCRDRPDRISKTIKGTRSLHSVKCLEKGVVLSRHLTCMCSSPLSGVGACMQVSITGLWETQTFGMLPCQQDPTPLSPTTVIDTILVSPSAAGPLVSSFHILECLLFILIIALIINYFNYHFLYFLCL